MRRHSIVLFFFFLVKITLTSGESRKTSSGHGLESEGKSPAKMLAWVTFTSGKWHTNTCRFNTGPVASNQQKRCQCNPPESRTQNQADNQSLQQIVLLRVTRRTPTWSLSNVLMRTQAEFLTAEALRTPRKYEESLRTRSAVKAGRQHK
jgi:hypothetical protein